MSAWTTVPLNTGCAPPTTLGVVKLPNDTVDLAEARVLFKAGSKKRLLKVDYRNDNGGGACLTERDHRALGQVGKAQYRPLSKLEALWWDGGLRLALFTTLVTFASTALGIAVAYDKATAPDPTSGAGPSEQTLWIAVAVAGLAFLIALLKLNKDLNEI